MNKLYLYRLTNEWIFFPFLNRSTRITRRRTRTVPLVGEEHWEAMHRGHNTITTSSSLRSVCALVAVRNNLLDGSASRRADSSMARLWLVPVMSPHRAVLHRRVSNTQNDAYARARARAFDERARERTHRACKRPEQTTQIDYHTGPSTCSQCHRRSVADG